MTVVDDLLAELRAAGNRGEVVSRGSQALEASPFTEAKGGAAAPTRHVDADGPSVATPPAECNSATRLVQTRDGEVVTYDELLERLKCPVLYTQVSPCEGCPHRGGWYTGAAETFSVPSCCEIDGTCWRAEQDERERLRAAGEMDTAPVAYAAPWSKRAIRDAQREKENAAVAAERKRQQREEEIKAERQAQGGAKKWGSKPIGNNPRFTEPKPPTETLAEAVVAEPKKKGPKPKLTAEQIEWAASQQSERSLNAVATEKWQEWGFVSQRAAYESLRVQVVREGFEVLDGRRLGAAVEAREANKRMKEAA